MTRKNKNLAAPVEPVPGCATCGGAEEDHPVQVTPHTGCPTFVHAVVESEVPPSASNHTEDRNEDLIEFLEPEWREFASNLSDDIGPFFGRDGARLLDAWRERCARVELALSEARKDEQPELCAKCGCSEAAAVHNLNQTHAWGCHPFTLTPATDDGSRHLPDSEPSGVLLGVGAEPLEQQENEKSSSETPGESVAEENREHVLGADCWCGPKVLKVCRCGGLDFKSGQCMDCGRPSACTHPGCLCDPEIGCRASSGGERSAWWLVERGQPEQHVPTVWASQPVGSAPYPGWSQDANEATRFESKAQAEAFIEKHCASRPYPSARAVEHVFITDDGPPSSPDSDSAVLRLRVAELEAALGTYEEAVQRALKCAPNHWHEYRDPFELHPAIFKARSLARRVLAGGQPNSDGGDKVAGDGGEQR